MSKMNLEKILRIEEIKNNIFYMEIESPYIVKDSSPGQFINIKCAEGTTPLLRRPICIADVNKETNSFSIYFKVVGEGTQLLSKKREGDFLDFIGPLGNGFKIEGAYDNVAIVGGGIGIFPLLLLSKSINCKNIHSFLGFDCEESIMLKEEFSCISKVAITTEDLSKGKRRLVTEALKDSIQKGANFNMIFVCGPRAMLIEISNIAIENNIKCQLSLEEKMGCGIGSCLVCACKTKIQKESENSSDKLDDEDWTYSRVCKEGPVFMGSELIWE
jgi:dihydroorotate dehydrogenase electron transfer subunit